jgi:NAD(P)-dependent dehydrogenase (short-subunit alcohol dehydrogenase family)
MGDETTIILVTGSTDGVGRRVAQRFGATGAHVLIHGRNAMRGGGVKAAVEASGGTARVYLADFASLDAVRALARSLADDYPRIDVLINNAGIGVGRPDQRELSCDGHELRFAVNYLSGFLLAHLLKDRIASGGRIINVASAGQHPIDFADVMLTRGYSGHRAYCQSKLAQIMFCFDLAQELRASGIGVYALHPATYMDTAMVRRDGIHPVTSVDAGADAIVTLAVARGLDGGTGLYFDGRCLSRANAQAYDAAARARLRAISLSLVGLETSSTSQS